MRSSTNILYRFGLFELDPRKRLLHRDGVPVPLSPKGFDLLIKLIENRDRVVTKDELMQSIWRDTFVEEGNLTQTISVLRKTLGEQRDGRRSIVTFPGRGYQFVGSVISVECCEPSSDLSQGHYAPSPERGSLLESSQSPVLRNVSPSGYISSVSPAPMGDYYDAVRSPSANLPIPPTPLIGREAEVREARGLLARPDVRLLTVTGGGGIGKTRLAIELARAMQGECANGVFFVSLAAVLEPSLVGTAIAHALELRTKATSPPSELLKEHLRDKRLLLLLDNFEQVISAALLIADLLAFCGGLKIVVTSRELLKVRAERVFRVRPLATPDPGSVSSGDTLLEHPATAMFVERAVAVNPDFKPTPRDAASIAGICKRLDGLPLAIELAAARISNLSPEDILARLENGTEILANGARDLPARQQTLRNTIAWSYDLLTGEERELLRRLAVFVGGFTSEAAEYMCAIDCGAIPMLDRLSKLLDKSMLVHADGAAHQRFTILETIREYALDRLEDSGEAETARCMHAEFLCDLAERAEPGIVGADASSTITSVDREIGNLRTAVRWSMSSARPDAALRIISALRRFWLSRGYVSEADRWSTEILSNRLPLNSPSYAKFLGTAGNLANHLGDYDRAIVLIEQGISHCRRLGSNQPMAELLMLLGETQGNVGNYDLAVPLFEESLSLMRERRDESAIALGLSNLGGMEYVRGNFHTAVGLLEQALSIQRGTPDARLAFYLNNLGMCQSRLGNFSAAEASLRESLTVLRALGEPEVTVQVLESCAEVASSQDQYYRMHTLMGAADAARESLQLPPPIRERSNREATLESSLGKIDAEARNKALREGRAMTLEQAVAYALESDTGDPT